MSERPTRFLLTLLALFSVLAVEAGVVVKQRSTSETRVERILVNARATARASRPTAVIIAASASRPSVADGYRQLNRAIVRHESRGPPSI